MDLFVKINKIEPFLQISLVTIIIIIIIIIIIHTLFYEGSILSYYNKYNKLTYNMAF